MVYTMQSTEGNPSCKESINILNSMILNGCGSQQSVLCMNAYICNVLGLPAFVTFLEFGFLIPLFSYIVHFALW